MIRWNIANIFFLGVSGQRRDVELAPNSVNIITGASGTGKSTLIKAVDYCLGSSKCELPAHVRRRSVAVGVKWKAGEVEMVVGRLIPPVGQATSTRMFVAVGRDLPLPLVVEDFDGPTTLEAAKALIERAFGIGDIAQETSPGGVPKGRATVRLVTPYLFVTKEVIYSESVLLHGLEKADKARDIVAAIPYFLRASDEESAIAEHRLRQLQRALEREEAKERSRAAADSAVKSRALNLLVEARRVGISKEQFGPDSSESALLAELRRVMDTRLRADAYPDEGELGALHQRRQRTLIELSDARRQLQATRSAIRDANGFEGAVSRQREKLMLAEHLKLGDAAASCPVCDSPSEKGRETARALHSALLKVRAESAAVERVRPKLIEHDRNLDDKVVALNVRLRQTDEQIESWLRQSEESRRLSDISQLQAHLLGRISFFLESSVDEPRPGSRDLSVLRDEIAELEAVADRRAKEVRMRRAEAKISQFASEAFSALPTVAPCVGSELEFSARPDINVIEADGGAILRMPDIGSDQNYLAIHIALSFALQRYFEVMNSPVPGLLIFDQISRPYFPTSGEGEDEAEIVGRHEDEDVLAMRRHVDFLFAETARRSGLQVLLIEHAFFADDPRYVAATRERWTRASGNALIPLEWPTRADG